MADMNPSDCYSDHPAREEARRALSDWWGEHARWLLAQPKKSDTCDHAYEGGFYCWKCGAKRP